MKPIHYESTTYEKMIICGIEGLFTTLRIDESTIPKGYNKYFIRHSDDGDEWFCTLEKFVWANHVGHFITPNEIIMEEYNCIYINNDYNYEL